MTESQYRGRRILWLHIFLMLLVSVVSIVGAASVANDPTRLPKAVIRLFIAGALCWWLYRGSPFARLLLVGLLCLGGGTAFALSLRDELFAQIMGFTLAVFYLAFAWLLLWSDPVKEFLAYQRGERQAE